MLLRTFGALTLEAESTAAAPAVAPRPLALLAVIAAAGSRGITRDRILGILWPDTEEEQARHTLAQTLYLLRRGTGRDWLASTTPMRLHEGIACDVTAFLDAVEREDLERAAALYTGPFLDGFYLSGAPQFEVWVEETRTRLHFTVLRVFETLARRAEERCDFRLAVHWWRRLTTMDPYNAVYARGLIEALSAAGDPTGAFGFALEYEGRVRRELETEPDESVRELIARLRAPKVAERRPASPAAVSSAPVTSVGAAPEASPNSPAAAKATRRVGSRVPLWTAAMVVLAGSVWFLASRASSVSTPFLAVGLMQAPDSVVRGAVFRDMLATSLARIEGLPVVANSRLVELLPGVNDASPPGATADAARRAGANELLEGEIAQAQGGLVLTLRRVSLPTGTVQRGYRLQAADSYALADSATDAIARDLHLEVPADAAPSSRTHSAIAYALYEEGLRAFYGANPAAALRLMEAALARDSLFAMAAFFGWVSARHVERYDVADRLLPVARRLAARTSGREQMLIESALARDHDPLTESLARSREFAARYPNDPDAQVALGSTLAAAGDWAGSVTALDRAIAIDSAVGATASPYCRVCSTINLLVTTYLWWDSLAAAERTARRLIAFRPEEPGGWRALIEPLLRSSRRAESESAAARASKLSAEKIDHSLWFERDLIRAGRADELEVRLVSELSSVVAERADDRAWLLTFSLRNQGRLKDAALLAARGIVPGSGMRLNRPRDAFSSGIIALEQDRPRDAARYFYELAASDRAHSAPGGYQSRMVAFHLTLAGTALAAAGDTAAVRALADSVERIGARSTFGRDLSLHFFLRGLLLQRQNLHGEAVVAFRRALFSTTEGYTRTNLELARSLMALRRPDEAIAVLRPALRGGVDGSNTYVTHTVLREALARAYAAAGQRDSAAAQYALVERAWRRADHQFAERYREARNKAAVAH